ncbi:MAG: CDP-diacylglycerol--glycerol-3-phosphate 3-phosphatidyltransferase [Elusimicrobia bacterium]|nr:CDP-diacylglycerol--glycerol-3-phosphate 3-phosphatidyltransferase [Elusimicrobiota bacterium]
MILNLPNKLTLSRIALAAIFVVAMTYGNLFANITALAIFIVASLTDALDGYIARKRNIITTFGIFLDPLADKLLISAALISFVGLGNLNIPAWMVIIIISREFVITGLRSIAADKNVIIPANNFGKFKTTSQIVAIIGILLILVLKSYYGEILNITPQDMLNTDMRVLGLFMLRFPFWSMLVVTALTLYSGITYVWANKEIFKHDENK